MISWADKTITRLLVNTVRGGVQILTNQRASRQFGLGYEHPTYILKVMHRAYASPKSFANPILTSERR